MGLRLPCVALVGAGALALPLIGPAVGAPQLTSAGSRAAASCGSVLGDRYSFADVNRNARTSRRYLVYTMGATSCTFAKRWASRLSYNRNRLAPLAPAWPDNPRTEGLALVGPLPPGYACRRAPSELQVTSISVGAVFCRKVPEPRERARFFFYPDLRGS